jgi:ethanolamine utilization cobalamin adenosyltransferase
VKKEFIGKSGFDRQTMFFHKEYMDSLRTNIQNALRILSSNKSTMQEKLSAQQAIESNQAEMRSLEYSPLYTFKQRYEELLRQPEFAGTLKQLNQLREAILSEDVEPTLSNVRVLMLQIDEGIFGFVPNPEQS